MIPKQLKDCSFCRIRKKTKIPFEEAWPTKPYSYEEVSRFFPGENYGVVCGYHDLAVIDCDKEELKVIVKSLLPETFSVKTGGGGTHYYYIIPELKKKIILNAGEEHLGEIQSYGSQVVGPGSLHPSGNEYEVIDNVGIETLSLEKLREVLGNFMEKEEIVLGEQEDIEDYKKLTEEIVKAWKEGERQELALSVSGFLRKDKRMGINKVKSIIKEVCEATKDEELKMRLRAVDETFKKDEKDIKGFTGLKKVNLKEMKEISIDKLADYLMENYTFKTIYGTTTEKVFVYEKGIYILKGREIIKTKVEELIQSKARTHIVNEVYEKIKRKTAISREDFHFIEEGLVCLENGIFNLKERKLIEHSPEHYFKTKLPIFYNPVADCPEIKKFFNETLYEQDIPLMQEWFGFQAYNRYFEKKATILFGDKDTGKTITINLLSAFVGEKNKTSLSLQKIAYGKTFDLLDLKDKYSNVYDDLGDRDINDTGGFKIATGGGEITGEEKFGDRISFRTFAKLTFATNKIPAIKNIDDEAYYSRWIPIPYDNQIKEENQDKFLLGKLTTKQELSGLFNWAIEGLYRLLKNNKFTFERSAAEIKDLMQRSSHPLSAFAQDMLEEVPGNKITKQDMYETYSDWCDEHNKSRFTKEKLGRNLERFCPFILAVGGSERAWLNVSLKCKDDTIDTLQKTMRGIE